MIKGFLQSFVIMKTKVDCIPLIDAIILLTTMFRWYVL